MTSPTKVFAALGEACLPSGAGRVESGTGRRFVHLVFHLADAGWATACPADFEGLDGAGPGRQVRPVLDLVDCPACLTAGEQVDAVNAVVAGQLRREAEARELLAGFFRWAASECPIGDGGAVLAVYDGGTRLHPMTPDERARAVELWVESTRRYPAGG